MTRRLWLYLRSRYLVTSFAVMVGCAVGVWALGPEIDDPYRHNQIVLLFTLLALTALAPGLAGADLDLDRGAGFSWPPRRAAHLILGGAVAVGLMTLAVHGSPLTSIAWAVRDAAGLTGLLGLGAVALGAGRGPVLCLLWTAAAIALPTLERPAYWVILTWMMQPTEATAATVTAVVLALSGVLTYALAGPRR